MKLIGHYMKLFLMLLFITIPFFAFAYDHNYSATGIDGKGNPVQGAVYSNNGDIDVGGEITDENGALHSFQGKWNGYGHVSGETDQGDSLELDTN